MKALQIFAGPAARAHIAQYGLQPHDIATIPGAAGGPKGLILGALDRYLFGDWLLGSTQPVDLVGASIGAWRMATACLDNPVAGFRRLEHDYVRQHYEPAPGEKRPSARHVSERFSESLIDFYGGKVEQVLSHPRYALHIVTSRGRGLLRREHRWGTPLGYLGAFLANAVRRRAMGTLIERVVFSSGTHTPMPLPFATHDYRTRQVRLTPENFNPALQASCSIPFVLQAVHNIAGAPPGAYWDGGITDYHLHLPYTPRNKGLVLYPHFQRQVIPGWLDKGLRWRHGATDFLDRMVLLAPNPEWVKNLPNAKLPDRHDFTYYGNNLTARVDAWSAACSASTQLVDEFVNWLERPATAQVQAL